MSAEDALRVRGKAAELVEQHALRLGMDEFGAARLVDAILAIPVEPAADLWCCHIIGPDDLHAAPDYETALRWAVGLNRLFASITPSPLGDPNMPLCVAQVERWQGTAAAHAEALPSAIKGMTPTPRQPRDYTSPHRETLDAIGKPRGGSAVRP